MFGVGLETVQLFVSLGALDVSNIPVLSFVFTNTLYSGVFAMLGGLIIVPVVSLITPGSRPKGVAGMFSCYEKTKTVEITDSLGK